MKKVESSEYNSQYKHTYHIIYVYVLCHLNLHNVTSYTGRKWKNPRQTSTLLLAPKVLCEAVPLSFPMKRGGEGQTPSPLENTKQSCMVFSENRAVRVDLKTAQLLAWKSG